MTKVTINPGVCGLITNVEVVSLDQMEVTLRVESDCAGIQKLFDALGNTFDSYELCLTQPGNSLFYTKSTEYLPGHASCPTLSGVLKAIEVECRLALPRDVSITFEK